MKENSYLLPLYKRLDVGFVKGKNAVTNASQHLNKQYTLNFDIEDFFDNIKLYMVEDYFAKVRIRCNSRVVNQSFFNFKLRKLFSQVNLKFTFKLVVL